MDQANTRPGRSSDDLQTPPSQSSGHQKKVVLLLQEVLLLRAFHANRGRSLQPREIGTLLPEWLHDHGKKGLLEAFNAMCGASEPSRMFATIADLHISLETLLQENRQEEAAAELTEENKKGMVLVLLEHLTTALDPSIYPQWQLLLKQAQFPQSLGSFGAYTDHFGQLTALWETLLAGLPKDTVQQINDRVAKKTISNQSILQSLRRFGYVIDDALASMDTANLTDHLLTEQVQEGQVQEHMETLQSTLTESKQLTQYPSLGTALVQHYPIQAPVSAQSLPEQVADYATTVSQHDADLGKALQMLHDQWGRAPLNTETQQVLCNRWSRFQQQTFTENNGATFLEGMAGSRLPKETLAKNYQRYLQQLYDVEQHVVSLDCNQDKQITIVFAKKEVVIDRSRMHTIHDLSDALQIQREIDVEKTTAPLSLVVPQHTALVAGMQSVHHTPMSVVDDLEYTITGPTGSVHGMLGLLSDPQGAVGVYDPTTYRSYLNGITPDATPLLVITKEQIPDYTFTFLPGQTLTIKTTPDCQDPWSALHVIQMDQLSRGGLELHDMGAVTQTPQQVFDTSPSALERDIPKFFASRFIDEADLPDEIKTLWKKRYPGGAPRPKAWIAQGIVCFNKTYLEKTYGIQITDIPRRFNGLELRDWIKQDPANKVLWYEKILPELDALKAHEVTHRLLTFHHVPDPLAVASHMLDQETLCGISEGKFDCTVDDQGVRVVHLADGSRVSLAAIESAIAPYIPGFAFDAVKRLDTQTLDAYEKDETPLQNLWETATQQETYDAVHAAMPLVTASMANLERVNSDVLRHTKKGSWYTRLQESSTKAQAAWRAFSREFATLDEANATVEELDKRKKKMISSFDKYVQTIEDNRNVLYTALRTPGDFTPTEIADYERILTEKGDTLIELYKMYHTFLQEKARLPEDQQDKERVDEHERISTAYLERVDESEQDLNNSRGALRDQRDALIAGGVLLTDPAVVAIDRKCQTIANKIARLQPTRNQLQQEVASFREQEETRIQSSEQTADEKFLTRFSHLKGDANPGFKDGTVLFLKLSDSQRPGKGSVRVKAELQNTQGNSPTYDLVIKGVTEGSAGEREGKVRKCKKTSEDLGKLIAQAKGDIYTFAPNTSMSALHRYITDGLSSTTPRVNDFQSSRNADNINAKREKKFFIGEKEHRAPVAYVGRTFEKHASAGNPDNYFYKVEQLATGVRLTDMEGKQQTLDPDAYMMFLLDKSLLPYTEHEYQKSSVDLPETISRKGHWTDNFISRKILKEAFKKFPAAFKHKKDQEAKYHAAIMYYKFTQGLGAIGLGNSHLFHLGEIITDAEGELDTNISQVIKGYQDRIGRSGEGDNSVHGSKTAKLIIREIFDEYSEKTPYRQKAAGYLMYAINSGGAYFRDLKKYAHEARRVQAILGTSHQQKFLVENKALLDRVRSNPNPSDADLDLLAKHELWYIKGESQKDFYLPIFGSKFGRTIEDQATDLGQASKSGEVGKALASKNIYEIYDAFRFGGVGNLTTKTALGGLQAMAEKVDDATTYSLFYKSLVQLMASGFGTSLNATGRGIIKDIARKRGIPMGLLIGDPLHPHKIVSLLDSIVMAQTGEASETLTAYIRKKVPGRDGKSIHAYNFNKSHSDVMTAIDGWWEQNGYTAMEALNYKNDLLFKAKEQATGERKAVIDDYFNKGVFNGYVDRPTGRVDIDGQSPFMENGIWNISPGVFQSVLFSRKGQLGEFDHPGAHELWAQVGSMIQQFDGLISQSSSHEQKKFILKFLLKKFKAYFGRDFSSKDFSDLENALIANRQEADPHENALGYIGYDSLIRHKLLGHPMIGKKKKFNQRTMKYEEKMESIQSRSKLFTDPIVEETIGGLIGLFDHHFGSFTREERVDIVQKVFA